MGQRHVTPRLLLPRSGKDALRLAEKCVDALDARHGRLNVLYLHAEAFDGRENARYVVDDGDRGADRHAEQGQNFRIAGCGEQHDGADHHGVQQQNDRGIDGVIEIGALHGRVAVRNAAVVAALHVAFQSKHMNGADIVQRLRHLTGHRGDGAAVIQLRGQHPLLHVAGKHSEQRQHQQQYQRKAGVFRRNDRHDREDAAGVRHHADNAGGKKRLHGIHIAGKARGHLAGVLTCQCACGQHRKLPRHFRAQRMRHFLTEQHQQAFLRGGKDALQREASEIAKHCKGCQRDACVQTVDQAGQQQRRDQRRRN